MELSKNVEKTVLKAQELRMKEGASDLYAEHVLLVLLKCVEGSQNDAPELSYKEMKAVDSFAEKKLGGLDSAIKGLESGLGKKDASVCEAGLSMLERAGNLSPDAVVTVENILKAIEQKPSSLVRSMMNKESDPLATIPEISELTPPVHAVPHQAPVIKPQPFTPPHNNGNDGDGDGDGLTPSQLGALLGAFAHILEQQNNSFSNSGAGAGPVKVKKHTKMGLINYRGGKVAAAIQYFLLSIAVPFLLLLGTELAFGWVTAPASAVGVFVTHIIVTAGLFSIAKGIALILGQLSNAFGNFLEMLADFLLIFCIAQAVSDAWGLVPYPFWLKLVVVIPGLLCLLIRNALYSHLRDQDNPITTKIMFQSKEGTAGKVFFELCGKTLVLPALIASVVWLFNISLPDWLAKTFWIIGFLMVYGVITKMWLCLSLRADKGRHNKGRGLIKFCGSLHYTLTICALVLFLAWLFAWFPLRKWIVIVMIVYSVLVFIISLILAIAETKS